MKASSVRFQWESADSLHSRAAVSLHSHTLHSREYLHFLPSPDHGNQVVRALARLICGQRITGWSRAWWTPPLTPAQAFHLERSQFENTLGLHPLVSLTDHDTIQAPLQLRIFPVHRHLPVSVEWTIPFGPTFFHLGIHGLPAQRAEALWAGMNQPAETSLAGWLELLHNIPGVLTVFNHPLWDECGIGRAAHTQAACDFLHSHRQCIHGVELNGMRPWEENRNVIDLAERFGLPAISGGDRHGREPNVCLNLTNASNFSEFAEEVRAGHSRILFLDAYRQHHLARIIHQIWEVLRDDPDHGLGWRAWNDRVFYHTGTGEIRSLREVWEDEPPAAVRSFIALAKLAGRESGRYAIRVAFPSRKPAPLQSPLGLSATTSSIRLDS